MLEQLETAVIDQAAWKRFLALGLPTRQWETYRYVRLNDLYKQTFAFERSVYTLNALPDGVIVLPLSEATRTYGAFLAPRLSQEERDPFAALNGAMCEEGLFVYVPPRMSVKLDIDHSVTSGFVSPRLHVFVGKEAEVVCHMRHNNEQVINSFADFAIDENASLRLTTTLDEAEEAWHFDAVRATLKRGSRFTSYAIGNGGATTRQDYRVQLLEEGAEAALYGVAKLEERCHHHVNVLMEHKAPHCVSTQHFKTVLGGISRASFEGKIYVTRAAQKTEAYQMNNSLILSKRASANSKPNLEIFADDVKASHGSTTGQLDEEQLFYLKTRGVPLEIAKQLLVDGFCGEILDKAEGYGNLRRFS